MFFSLFSLNIVFSVKSDVYSYKFDLLRKIIVATIRMLLKQLHSIFFLHFWDLKMISHQENHAKWKVSADSQKTSVQQLNEQLEKAKLELEEAQDTVSNLHQQVQDRNEVIEAANEALLIKVSKHKSNEITLVNSRLFFLFFSYRGLHDVLLT